MDACGISEGTLAKARKERIPVFHVEDNFGPATWVFFVCFGNSVERSSKNIHKHKKMNYTETDNLSDGNVHQTIMRWLTKQMFGFLGGDFNRVPGNEKCFFQTLFDRCIFFV